MNEHEWRQFWWKLDYRKVQGSRQFSPLLWYGLILLSNAVIFLLLFPSYATDRLSVVSLSNLFIPFSPQKSSEKELPLLSFFPFSISCSYTSIWFLLRSETRVWLVWLEATFRRHGRKPYLRSDLNLLWPRARLICLCSTPTSAFRGASNHYLMLVLQRLTGRRRRSDVSYETCRVSAKSDEKQQPWGEEKCIGFSFRNWAVIKDSQSKFVFQKLFFFMSEISEWWKLQ